MKKTLISPEQAFRAMFVFLDEYYKRSKGEAELGDVLGDIQLMGDAMPADPAAWGDWLSAIDTVCGNRADASARRNPR